MENCFRFSPIEKMFGGTAARYEGGAHYTGLFEMNFGVLTTCHTHYA
jgi:hypothetical protein